jgi:thiamine pyrophosphokinase
VGAAPSAERVFPRESDFIIAADGGYCHLRRWGISPNLTIGDLDSLGCALPEGALCRTFPAEKDETDMQLALDEGLARGYRRFVLVGAEGGRLDHTLANVQLLLRAARRGAYAELRGSGWRGAAVCPERPQLRLRGKGTVSVFACGEARGVTIEGMRYALQDGALYGDTPRGISNELDGEGVVKLKEGALLCLWQEGIEENHRE